MENGRLVKHVNTDEEKRVKRQRAISYIQSTLDYKYFICSAWLRVQGTSELVQDAVVPDWADLSVKKRAWEQAVQDWRNKLKMYRLQKG